MANVVFLWHMHQPYYVDSLSRTAVMPWVRLHCVKGYLDMISVVAEFPSIRVNFNLTPVLLQQIEEIVDGRVSDLWLERSRKPASELDEAEKVSLLADFFKANWGNLIKPEPRYAELLAKRGEHPDPADLPRIARQWTDADFLDLQVWFNLAWCGYTARRRYPELAELRKKGRNFTENEKCRLLEIHLDIMRSIPGAYREAEERGQVELTTTPYFHPILPLVYDSALAERSLPGRELPRRFHWPQDAEAQLRLAVDNHKRLFGRAPRGLWPSEGSIAPEMIPLMQQVGIEYFCSDEENLFQSIRLDPAYAQTRLEHLELFQGWNIKYNGAAVNGVFRDRPLSDFIGFTAARNEPAQAARHLIGHFLNIAAHIPPGQGLIPVVLDGENAWEHFSDGGEAFLRALYGGIEAESKQLSSSTIESYFREHPPVRGLTTLHTGSWIGSNFDVWIGEPEENRAWDLLGETRRFLQTQIEGKKLDAKAREAALREVYAAEGSDWFWWYGPDFSTENDALFDGLFRQHLRNVYVICNVEPPAVLDEPIRGYSSPVFRPPSRRIAPRIGAGEEAQVEWLEAGTYLPGAEQGTMHRGDRVGQKLWFGCDRSSLYLRLDVVGLPGEGVPLALWLQVTRSDTLGPVQARTDPIKKDGPVSFTILPPGDKPLRRSTAFAGLDRIEWKLALRDLDVGPGVAFSFQVALLAGGIERERYPEGMEIPLCS